ncbi:MAG: hypothetical protein H7Y20_09215, partial [Bryobacteraceae bacterium]|nr:hypothetical protein [Bryobacteraceae bacterium]
MAGTELLFRGEGRPAAQASLGRISSLAVDSQGRIVFADPYYHVVFRVERDGTIQIIAGNGVRGISGDGGQAKAAALNTPNGVAYDAAGNLYIADSRNHRIRKVTAAGIISTSVGTGQAGFDGDGGQASSAKLNFPISLTVDRAGNLFINDRGNGRIRRVAADSNVIFTAAGNGRNTSGTDSASAVNSSFSDAEGITTDSDGNLYVAELTGHKVRKVTPQGVISTIAGTGRDGFSGDNSLGINSQVNSPAGLTFDAQGALLIVDAGNGRIRRLDQRSGVITTIAGNGPGPNGLSPDGTPANQ